jgi:predicted small lipoprotein YifL
MKRFTFAPLLFVIASSLLVAACGQKGPLYLPDEEGTVVTRPGTQTPDEEEEGRTQRPQPPPR